MHLLFWLIDGIAVGWLSPRKWYYQRNPIMDFVMGVAGALGGGFLVSASPFFTHGEMVWSNLGALLGAAVLIFFSRYFGVSRDRDTTITQRASRMNRLRHGALGFMRPRELAYARSPKKRM